MPGYDGSGPLGKGPNGRGLGPCGDDIRLTKRRFFGFRRGGRGSWWGGRLLRQEIVDNAEDLRAEKNWLKQQLERIDARLDEIKED